MAQKIFTVSELIEKIQDEMDLQEESFFDQSDFINAINDGIDEAEQEVMQLNEGYFNTSATLNLVSGTAAYSLPTDIYSAKIKLVQFYRNSSDYYKIHRIKLRDIADASASTYSQGTELMFDIQYPSSAIGQQIVFYPTPLENLTAGVRLWYIRNAERVALLTDLIDIPDAHMFIFSFVKCKVAMKEMSPLLSAYKEELEQQRQQLRETMSQMIPDEDEEIERDGSFYQDFDSMDAWKY